MNGNRRQGIWVMAVVVVCLALVVAPALVQAQETGTRVQKPAAKPEVVAKEQIKVPPPFKLILVKYEGRVVADGGAPLPGIKVTITGPGTYTATTDAKGVFRFPGIKPGKYTVTLKDPKNVYLMPGPSQMNNLWTLVEIAK